MDKLQIIWNKIKVLERELGDLVTPSSLETIVQKLQTEGSKGEKYRYWSIPIILIVGLMMVFVIYQHGKSMDLVFGLKDIIGTTLIMLGAAFMTYWLNQTRFDFNHHENNNLANTIKNQLLKRKRAMLYAPLIFLFFLTIGLHLLIFTENSFERHLSGMVFGFYGLMFAVLGFTHYNAKKEFENRYGSILKRVELFLVNDQK